MRYLLVVGVPIQSRFTKPGRQRKIEHQFPSSELFAGHAVSIHTAQYMFAALYIAMHITHVASLTCKG